MTFLFNRLLVVFLIFSFNSGSFVTCYEANLDSDLIYMDSILGDNYVDSISKPIDFLGLKWVLVWRLPCR